MVAAAGAGPIPILQREIKSESLSYASRYYMSPEASNATAAIAQRMQSEKVEAAGGLFIGASLSTTYFVMFSSIYWQHFTLSTKSKRSGCLPLSPMF